MKELRCEICSKTFKNQNALDMHNNSKHSKRRNSSGKFIIIGVVLIAIVVLFFALRNNDGSSDNVQKITLSFGSNYEPNTIEVKQGVPVEITLDSGVTGCYRAFTIPQLGVSKISKSPSDKIIFTPDKAGIFRFQCGMNMGYGTIIVT